MVIYYDFGKYSDYEYEVDTFYAIEKLCKSMDRDEVQECLERFVSCENLKKYLDGDKLESLDKSELIEAIFDLDASDAICEYYEDEVYDICYKKALHEYEDNKYDYWE